MQQPDERVEHVSPSATTSGESAIATVRTGFIELSSAQLSSLSEDEQLAYAIRCSEHEDRQRREYAEQCESEELERALRISCGDYTEVVSSVRAPAAASCTYTTLPPTNIPPVNIPPVNTPPVQRACKPSSNKIKESEVDKLLFVGRSVRGTQDVTVGCSMFDVNSHYRLVRHNAATAADNRAFACHDTQSRLAAAHVMCLSFSCVRF
jgi:hypothetical protein